MSKIHDFTYRVLVVTVLTVVTCLMLYTFGLVVAELFSKANG